MVVKWKREELYLEFSVHRLAACHQRLVLRFVLQSCEAMRALAER